MPQSTDQILQKLQDLMMRQGAFQDEFPGTPFVNSEKEFGITMGPLNGGLYAMHHLIDSLNLSQFFDGPRTPRTDLDAMAYEFGLDSSVEVYKGVIASRTKENMTLTITTDHPVDKILSALDVGIDAAQAHLDQREQEALEYAQMVRAEFAKENFALGPVFNDEVDIAFVENYLRTKTNSYFTGEPNANVEGPLAPRDYLATVFLDYNVIDQRPRFAVNFTHTEENYGPFNTFHNSVLRKVFTAPLAVDVDQLQDTPAGTIQFEVRGNPSRLARDIILNDLSLATIVAQDMGLIIALDKFTAKTHGSQGGGTPQAGLEDGPS